MRDEFAKQVVEQGDDDVIRLILAELCNVTRMGFAAVARVTEERWIACQVEDRIEFGLDPGDELNIKQTICDDIRQCGQAIVIDEVGIDPVWRTHPIPMLYGFESYASLPITLDDGSFYGTLCVLDPEPRALSAKQTVETLMQYADRVARILSRKEVPPANSALDACPAAGGAIAD
ncbi:MAG: GAF domain-containing protein [Sphingomonas sp.]|uniref:GAF domain-containing protein n=1 Tax=Sphingomonas sp. TaxID=28214 RepID=UPI001790AEE1|nr:GAF domain-containing protein [Sphingomonas sp.]MBA3667244.1 GAF domain-containing protein [Sphingomonas sp.]